MWAIVKAFQIFCTIVGAAASLIAVYAAFFPENVAGFLERIVVRLESEPTLALEDRIRVTQIESMQNDENEHWVVVEKLPTERALSLKVLSCTATTDAKISEEVFGLGKAEEEFYMVLVDTSDSIAIVLTAGADPGELSRIERWEKRGFIWARTRPPEIRRPAISSCAEI